MGDFNTDLKREEDNKLERRIGKLLKDRMVILIAEMGQITTHNSIRWSSVIYLSFGFLFLVISVNFSHFFRCNITKYTCVLIQPCLVHA
jgi:hypothetical protein